MTIDKEQNNETGATPEQQPQQPQNQATTEVSDDKILGLEAEISELKNKLLRTLADGDNTRKRLIKDIEDAGKYAVSNFAVDMVDVLENLYRAMDSVSLHMNDTTGPFQSIYQGIEMTRNIMLSKLEKHGIKRVCPVQGDDFDHNMHQAVSQVPSDEVPHGKIVGVIKAGYTIADRLLSPAIVSVAQKVTQDIGAGAD